MVANFFFYLFVEKKEKYCHHCQISQLLRKLAVENLSQDFKMAFDSRFILKMFFFFNFFFKEKPTTKNAVNHKLE